MTTTVTPQKDYSIKQFAELLSVTPKTVYVWDKKGIIETYKIGGITRVKHESYERVRNGAK